MSIGLDIGTKSLKILEAERSGKNFQLKGSGVIGYKGFNIEQLDDEKEMAIVGQVIAKLHKQANIPSKLNLLL